MPKEESKLKAAKASHRNASAEGNRQEEARWANVIGNILKNRGEYVEALKWLRIDYEISIKYLPEKQIFPTCQSLGEVYLSLEHFKDALIYQKKHLDLAKRSDELVEQQRASTQLGRTYHEMFLRSSDDHYSVRNAKKYFKLAMKLAQTLKVNPPPGTSFLKEFVDAHNNIGMLELDLDNLEESEKFLTKGLNICDEEEIVENDAARSRLHHNLGNVYIEMRMWDKAREHIEKDIITCKNIEHLQGEAKGYINLGELHYRVQRYGEAILCYKKALDIARSMEDEDAMVNQIDQNIETVNEAIKVMDGIKEEEQSLKKLSRKMPLVRGKPKERKWLLQQNASLDHLIDKSSMIFAWLKHHEFAKRKKRIASELCDKEKLSDSYLVIGESYQKLRKFDKALKWYTKAWDVYKLIGNLEGQALVKINIGDALDCHGDWAGALSSFEEGYGIAVEAKLPSIQISALENMHYSHMIRFDNVDEARRLQILINDLKQSNTEKNDSKYEANDCCSETDTDNDDCMSESRSNASSAAARNHRISPASEPCIDLQKMGDDAPLSSFLRRDKYLSKHRASNMTNQASSTSQNLSKSSNIQHTVIGHKRVRLVLSDDEGEVNLKGDESECYRERSHDCSSGDGHLNCLLSSRAAQVHSAVASRGVLGSSSPGVLEESTCSYKSSSYNLAANDRKRSEPLESFHVISSKNTSSTSNYAQSLLPNHDTAPSEVRKADQIAIKIDNELIYIDMSCMADNGLSIESVKEQVACLYYLHLPLERRMKGLLPIIKHLIVDGVIVKSVEDPQMFKNSGMQACVEAIIDGWVQKLLMKAYLECCEELSESPNMRLLKNLYNMEVSEDELVLSECELQDVSIMPLLNALHVRKTIATMNLSHNLLGNRTIEKLQQVLSASGQKYGGFILDLHCNRFGPTALFQICECSVLFARLEVLNISENRLTDACASYLSNILENCKVLYSLKMENCSITSRTVQKLTDSLNSSSMLSQLWIGHNAVTASALMNLLLKLATLNRFSELSLSGTKLNKAVLDKLLELIKASSISSLMLGGTNIGNNAALQLAKSMFTEAQDVAKFDLSYCGLSLEFFSELTALDSVRSASELNFSGNALALQGGVALGFFLVSRDCCIRVLVMNKCQLGDGGVLRLLQALADNDSVEEVDLSENIAREDPCHQIEVVDSEDEEASGKFKFSKEASDAITKASALKLLDLSGNGLTKEVVEMLYFAWCAGSRAGLARRHVWDGAVHFSTEEKRCCKIRPCCRSD